MLKTALLGILHLTCIIGGPVIKLSPPTDKSPTQRQEGPRASQKSIDDYKKVESSLNSLENVWKSSRFFKKMMQHEFAGFRTQAGNLKAFPKHLPPSQLRSWTLKLKWNRIIGNGLAQYRQKKIDAAEIRMLRLLTLGYHSLKDGRVADAIDFMKRAKRKQKYFQALQTKQIKAKIPSSTMLDNARYRMYFEEFLIARHTVLSLLERTTLERALRQIADRRVTMEKEWNIPLAPDDSDKMLIRRLVALRKKKMAIQAAVLATHTENAARASFAEGNLVHTLQNIRKTEVLQNKAERLRSEILIPSETRIDLHRIIQERGAWVKSEKNLIQENESSSSKAE